MFSFVPWTLENTWFREHFGINDFEPITYEHASLFPLGYIQKYMSKTGNKMKYSRHMPSYEIKELPDDRDKISVDPY